MPGHRDATVGTRLWWRQPALSRRGWVVLAAVAVVMVLSPQIGSEAPGRQSALAGSLALVTALGQAGALAWRRTRPEAVAAVVLLLYAVSVPLVGLAAPVAAWVAVWAVGTGLPDWRRALRAVAVATAALVGVLVIGDLARSGAGGSQLLVGVTVVVALAAALVRSERGRLDAARTATAAEERLRIARDLHDLVGHGLSAVAVQSSTARLALSAGDEAAALTALSGIESSSRSAMREMRQLLGVLAGRDADTGGSFAPAPGLGELPALVDNTRSAGVTVTWETDVDTALVPAPTQLCIYRVAQEALTNCVKHAPGSEVAVSLVGDAAAGPGSLLLRVTSSAGLAVGTAPGTADHTGVGVAGIQARVRSAGGTAVVGPTAHGWLVEAWLPLATEAR